MLISKYILYGLILFSVFLGIKTRKLNNSFFKILLFQVGVYAVLMIWLPILKHYNVNILKSQNHNILYLNIHLAIETLFLLAAAFFVVKSKFVKNSILAFSICFGLVYGYQTFIKGIFSYNYPSDVLACIILTITFSIVLYQFINTNKGYWWKSPEILTSIGILLYFAGSVPFVSMSNYLAKKEPDLYFLLFRIISDGLANIRYLLLALSFIIIYRSRGKNQLQL